MSSQKNAVALCALGAEKVVSNEIRKLGLSVIESGFGRVRFKAGIEGLYRALMGLRAADRVLLEAASFRALDFDELFEGVRAAAWEEYIGSGLGLRVAKVRCSRSRLAAETSVQAVVHKAAAERLCQKRGQKRLAEDAEQAELRVYIEKDQVFVLLDISGEPLFKRGYRKTGGTAPIRETTAAAMILYSGWRRKFPLYDPFCGSGTIAIEAAMYAWDMAPNLGRQFAIDRLLLGDRNMERKVREELMARVDFSRLVRIGGSDSDAASVSAARANMERAAAIVQGEREKLPSFQVLPMEEAVSDGAEGFIITNPPYGRRLGDAESSERTYTEMGSLARQFSGWKLVLITDHPGFESFFGRKADSCREMSNGAIRSYLFQYESLRYG
ncbi:MAG: class I SAM-dependent RNA methyltransferase [Treponema sp.]|nr:class I SAM-dependent RNA methyltransferase [Treponema sp.]